MKQIFFNGNPPSQADGWEMLCDVTADGAEWSFFRCKQKNSKDWVSYKIVSKQPVKHKANFWFAHNNKNGQLAFTRDLSILISHYKELFDETNRIVRIGT